ncbi:MAG: single-stranded-DNA-specific exonuclease RecJ [Xanthomonadaceae bacterium]|jgi:single-stranded-DNA-specific exonuclease|nr:single-stranded-DNA-specific exonuclease RecJ [Xanthomonadaceae bacterium]
MKPVQIRRRPPASQGQWPESLPPLLQRIYAARGALDLEQARPPLARLLPPDALSGLRTAVRLLSEAIDADRRIVVVGDFDCDGATACAVGVRGLRMLGAGHVAYAVPNRMVHGYGLSPALVAELAAMRPDILVTVDQGVACHAGVAAARDRGWQVVVTDHHLPGESLPAADAIVDPNLDADGFASKALAGVGVIFYVLLALRRYRRELGLLRAGEPDLGVLLDLVAVGTVADLVPLDANNRALVGAGLRRLRAGHGCAGLRALIEVSQRQPARLTATDIGFALGPRLNAAGRLEDMALGIECLLCDDPARARELAESLNAINSERRQVQQRMTSDAEAALARVELSGTAAPATAVCLFDAQWHQGVVGLVASRMKERLYRPVIAFAPTEPGAGMLRGSGRSIPGFHLRDALVAVDAMHPGLIERFGGHAMAAGLSLDLRHLPAFQQALEDYASRTLDEALLQSVLWSDGELLPGEFDRFHAEALRDGGPWGQGFSEPLFDGVFELIDWRVLRDAHLKLTLAHPSGGKPLSAIHFNGWHGQPPGMRLHLAYRLMPDDYRGGDAVQLVVEHHLAVA